MPLHLLAPPSVILLDIEGTTCPITFVSEVLFPYASQHLPGFLESHRADPHIQHLLDETTAAWNDDDNPEAEALQTNPEAGVVDYLQLLIRQNRKLTPLKDLQGLIWQQGYSDGALNVTLFADVALHLQQWQQQGIQLAVYSSGSVAAQKLLYGHTTDGDLCHLFSAWFDTRIGQKQAPASYEAIASALRIQAPQILFLSDAVPELEAAHAADMVTALTIRPGNPTPPPCRHASIQDFSEILWPETL